MAYLRRTRQSGFWMYLLIFCVVLAIGVAVSIPLNKYFAQRQDAEILSHLQTEFVVFENRNKSLNLLLSSGYQCLRTQKIFDAEKEITDADRFLLAKARTALSDAVSSYTSSASLPIEDLLFYIARSEITITPQTIYTFPKLCQLYFEVDQDALQAFLNSFLLSGRSQQIRRLQGKTKSYLLYMRHFAIIGRTEHIVSMAVLTDQMFQFDSIYEGKLYLATQDGQIFSTEALPSSLPGFSDFPKEEGRLHCADHEVFFTSNKAGYRLAMAVPSNVYYRTQNRIRIGIFVFVVLVGIDLCILLYSMRKREKMRINQLGNLLQLEEENNITDFEAICSSLNHIINQNTDLRIANEKMEQQVKSSYAVMRNSFVRMLILGNVPEDDLPSLLNMYNISTSHSRYRVLLLQLDNKGVLPEPVATARQMLLMMASTGFNCDLESCVIDDYTVGVLLMFEPEEKQALMERVYRQVDRIIKVTAEKEDMTISTSLGRTVQDIGKIHLSYHWARVVLSCSSRDELKKLGLSQKLSTQDSERLMCIQHSMEQGNSEKCLSIFDEMFIADADGNYDLAQRSCALMLFSLFDDFVSGNPKLSKLFIRNDTLAGRLRGCITMGEILSVIRSMLAQACDALADAGEDRSRLLIHRAVQILQERYADCSLSQTVIADELGMTPAVLSSKFKEIVGVNMSVYLRELRLEHTRKLLRESQLTLAEIVEQTGFGSTKTMYRVFKADCGLTPGEYRDASSRE